MFADSDQQREKCSRIRTKNGARKRAPDSTPKTAKNVRGFGRKTTPQIAKKKGPEKGREKSRGNLRGNLRGNFLAQIPLFSHVFGPQIFTFGIFLRRNLGPKNRFSRPFSGAVFPPFFSAFSRRLGCPVSGIPGEIWASFRPRFWGPAT